MTGSSAICGGKRITDIKILQILILVQCGFVRPIFMLFLIIGLNLLLKRLRPKVAMSEAELLIIYFIVVISGTYNGHDMLQNLLGSIGHSTWFATEENEWNTLFLEHVPGWLFVKDKDVLRGFYEGGESFNMAVIKAWLSPMAVWTIFMLALIFIMMCINVLVRRQWTEHEKIAYPIIQLPVAMMRQGGASGFFSNKVMWMGFGSAFALSILNGIHFLYPVVPELRVSMRDVGHYFTTKPWNAVGWVPISLFPFAIGLAFFLPLDLSFSCWFFYVFRKALRVIGASIGVQNLPGFPYFNEQASGAWIALGLVALWITRRHLKDVFKTVIGYKKKLDDSGEPMSYRWAVFGLISGMFFLILFSARMGISAWISLALFSVYFILSIAMTRVRAELGTPHEIYFVNPQEILLATIGTKYLSIENMTGVCSHYWWNRCYRSHQMPQQLEAFKMAEIFGMNRKRFPMVIVLASFIAIVTGFWIMVSIYYKEGTASGLQGGHMWVGWETFNRLQRWLNNPRSGPDGIRLTFMGVGFFSIFVMMFMRMRFFWWPFHPAGYALAISYAMEYYWFAFFVSWLIKWVLLKFGGLRTHRNAIPFFMGLILGDYAMGSIWSIIGAAILHAPVYRMFY